MLGEIDSWVRSSSCCLILEFVMMIKYYYTAKFRLHIWPWAVSDCLCMDRNFPEFHVI